MSSEMFRKISMETVPADDSGEAVGQVKPDPKSGSDRAAPSALRRKEKFAKLNQIQGKKPSLRKKFSRLLSRDGMTKGRERAFIHSFIHSFEACM